jgi:hypothetical protein
MKLWRDRRGLSSTKSQFGIANSTWGGEEWHEMSYRIEI